MHSNRDTMQQQQQHQNHGGSVADLQYYEITPTGRESSNNEGTMATTAHLHPINLCTVERLPASGIISQHQLQDILPGAVFAADPSMAHLHYHIIPSPARRTLNCSEANSGSQSGMQGCRSHSRMEQVHLHEHHQHYQRQPKFVRPPSSMNELAIKERDRSSVNFDNLRYSQMQTLEKSEKNKNMSLAELNDSQATISGTKGSNGGSKCQCHAIHELRLKRDREAMGIQSEDDEGTVGQHRHPPALPPRPPPRPTGRRLDLPSVTAANQRHVGNTETSTGGGCCKKYVVLCCLCGGLSAAVGSLFLAVHAVLSAHTASLALFETVPSYIPGTMLIFMGLFTMLLARRKHRYGFLMKVCGSVSVVCALVCVLVTVTTTVVHMSRLQGLRECVYTARAKSCTCYGAPQSRASDPGVLFEGTPHCEAVHGALYACLRALFGVSVAGILACIFSCMLVYQLFSHEKKKMYWEQLELRCRSLYGQGPGGAAGLVSARPAGTCGCCNDCGGIGPWWAQSPGNLYTPNPDLAPSRRWRLPWSRSRGPAPTGDGSNYGFHGQAAAIGAGNGANQEATLIDPTVAGLVPYSILGPQSHAGAYSMLQAAHHDDHYGQNSGASPYSVLEAAVPLWGPPPPYSDPNSPARRPMIAFPQADPRARLTTKRMENFQREVDYGRTVSEIKRPSDNYENAEQVSNDTDTETSGCGGNNVTPGVRVLHARGVSSSSSTSNNKQQHKKLLKGVDNAGFQPQETNSMIAKQSESELYFGDVSSCCGPESSLYDVATEKDGKGDGCQAEAGTSNYHSSSHFPKRPSSKRSRRQHQQQQQQQQQQQLSSSETVDMPRSNSSLSSSDDLPDNAVVSYSVHTSTVDYDLIRQQRRYAGSQSSYSDKSPKEEAHMMVSELREDSDDGAYGADEESEKKDNESEFKDFKDDYDEDMRPVKV